MRLRLIRMRPKKGVWIKYLFLPLVLLVALTPKASGELRALLTVLTTVFLILYTGFAVWQMRRPNIILIGYLEIFADELILAVQGQQTAFALDNSLRLTLTYRGFRNEAITNRIRATGLDNFVQLDGSESYRFEMPTEQAQEALRRELRRWYLLKVKVKEYRQDGPTFLLHRNLSYEQIQAYKAEFGVSLYG